MKKFIAVLIVVAMLAAACAALADSLTFTGSCYTYKKPHGAKTGHIIKKGSELDGQKASEKGWYEVDLDGKTVYVREKYVKEGTGNPVIYGAGGQGKSTVAGSEYTVKGSKVKATGRVNVRSEGSLSGKVLGTMQKGETAKFLGKAVDDSRGVAFYKITWKGKTAWVSSGYSEVK